jgi:hypothetical protein
MAKRKCKVCGKSKNTSNFYYNKAKKVFFSRCKDCMIKYQKTYDKKHCEPKKNRDVFLPEFKLDIKDYAGDHQGYIKFLTNEMAKVTEA